MKAKLIACEVFTKYFCRYIATSPNLIIPEFLPIESHLRPNQMKEKIQSLINKYSKTEYNYILLGFGLCGNATNGIYSNEIPLVIPNIHDCCTMFLGSNQSFYKNFKDNPSSRWTCSAYMEHYKDDNSIFFRFSEENDSLEYLYTPYEEFVKQYGEENAKFLWKMLHGHEDRKTDICYICCDMKDDEENVEMLRHKAYIEDLQFTVLHGNTRMFKNLISKRWDKENFLYVPPFHKIVSNYEFIKPMKTIKI